MNVWSNVVITDKGLALLAKLTQGNSLIITKAVAGTGFVSPDMLGQQTDVTEPKQELKFLNAYYPKNGECALPVLLTNEGLKEGYKVTQIGLFAMDKDEGEILYLILQSVSAVIGTIVPSEEEMPGYTAEWKLFLQYGQADKVIVTTDPANLISRAEMEAYIETYVEEEFVPITNAQIDALSGIYSDGGDIESGGTTSGVGTLDHSQLMNRNIANQHTIESITGLEEALNKAEGTDLGSVDIESVWNNS